jgi:putative transcriptional regulator
MRRLLSILAICCCVFAHSSLADEKPATGKLLVATNEVRGSSFFHTVILLLHYDESGALGLVINRPTEATPDELLPELEGIEDYEGVTYWGGPVRLASMRALHRTDTPTDDEIFVVDNVYQMPLDTLPTGEKNQQNLRFFIGYAGWSPGQLDREILFGSWDIIQATEDTVFTNEPDTIWETLSPPRSYRASAE